MSSVPVIDVHTHMLSEAWVAELRKHGGPKYEVKPTKAGQETVFLRGNPFMTLTPGMFDYDLRIANMDKAGVDVSIVSLTCPSVYWGGEAVSSAAAAAMNDLMAYQQSRYPDRIRFFASLPWQYAASAVAELERAVKLGAVGCTSTGSAAGLGRAAAR